MKKKGEEATVITFDPKPCYKCARSNVVGRDRLGSIYGCRYLVRKFDAATHERSETGYCGPLGQNWVKKS